MDAPANLTVGELKALMRNIRNNTEHTYAPTVYQTPMQWTTERLQELDEENKKEARQQAIRGGEEANARFDKMRREKKERERAKLEQEEFASANIAKMF